MTPNSDQREWHENGHAAAAPTTYSREKVPDAISRRALVEAPAIQVTASEPSATAQMASNERRGMPAAGSARTRGSAPSRANDAPSREPPAK